MPWIRKYVCLQASALEVGANITVTACSDSASRVVAATELFAPVKGKFRGPPRCPLGRPGLRLQGQVKPPQSTLMYHDQEESGEEVSAAGVGAVEEAEAKRERGVAYYKEKKETGQWQRCPTPTFMSTIGYISMAADRTLCVRWASMEALHGQYIATAPTIAPAEAGKDVNLVLDRCDSIPDRELYYFEFERVM